MVHVRSILADSVVLSDRSRLYVRHRERPHDLEENVSHTTTPKSNDRLDAIIGTAAAGSVVLLIVAIFLGYWLKTRRRRRCPPSQTWIMESPKRPALEAPRKARKHSIVLSLLSPTLTRPKPLWLEKPLPSPPLTASLLSSDPFSAVPMNTSLSSEKAAGAESEKTSSLGYGAMVSSPPPIRTKLGPVRMLSTKKSKVGDEERLRTALVAQEVDSGVRLVDQVVVPPPYTFK